MRCQRSATECHQCTFDATQNIYSLPPPSCVTFPLTSFRSGQKENVNIHVLASTKAEPFGVGAGAEAEDADCYSD